MKKHALFITTMFLFGLAVGAGIVIDLLAIPAFDSEHYLLSVAEKADFDRMAAFARAWTGTAREHAVFLASLAASIVAAVLLLLVLNPRLASVLRDPRRENRKAVVAVKSLVALLCALGWFALITAPLQTLFSNAPALVVVVQALLCMISTGVLWLAAGETGWGGETASFKLPLTRRTAGTFGSGVLAGAAIFMIFAALHWSMSKYFILASEVLDRSGETSYLGLLWLGYGTVLATGIAFAFLAGVVSACAPVQFAWQERKHRMVFLASAALLACVVVLGTYAYAGRIYDLNEESLSAALSISERTSENKTLVLFHPSAERSFTVRKWPLELTVSGIAMENTIALSPENLQKAADYVDAHPGGSVYKYAALAMLMRGYHALWDDRSGLAWQARTSGTMLVHRLLLLERLRYLPVTPDNLAILESLGDRTKWRAGGRAAVKLAAAYRHFGRMAESERWLRIANERNADLSSSGFPKRPVITNGRIRGRFVLNGKPLDGAGVALIGLSPDRMQTTKMEITPMTLPRSLVAVRTLGAGGAFVFDRLGSGEYALALIADPKAVPFDGGSHLVTAVNAPGVITLGPARSRDLGEIGLTIGP